MAVPSYSRASTIGFIGLGAMGHGMAVNIYTKAIAAAHAHAKSGRETTEPSLVVCELSDERAEGFMEEIRAWLGEEAAERITRVSTASEMVKLAARIITMLPATAHVEEVYLGPSGLVAGLDGADTSVTLVEANKASPWWLGDAVPASSESGSAHTLFIDSTTLDPVAAKRIARTVAKRTGGGALMVDGPVSGGITGANAGTLTIMLGAETPFSRAMATPLIQYAARPDGVVYCGGSGAGIGLKVCNNLTLSINQIALSEGYALGKALGIDPVLLHNVFNSSTARSWASSTNSPLPEVDAGPGFHGYDTRKGFATTGMIKDVSLALNAAQAVDLPTPLLARASEVYKTVAEYDGGKLAQKDFTCTYLWLNELQAKAAAEKQQDK